MQKYINICFKKESTNYKSSMKKQVSILMLFYLQQYLFQKCKNNKIFSKNIASLSQSNFEIYIYSQFNVICVMFDKQ